MVQEEQEKQETSQENQSESQNPVEGVSADLDDMAEAIANAALEDAGLAGKPEIPDLPDFSGMLSDAAQSSIELLSDVELNVKIELGRTEMTVDEILRLNSGSVVELHKLAGDPVDILVNEQLVARGEVLVINDNFCVRINEIVRSATEEYAEQMAAGQIE